MLERNLKMKIEFKNLDDRFEVIEHVIRDKRWEYTEDGMKPIPHLQAILFVKDFDDECVDFSISYYSADNEFLGLDDSDTLHLSQSKDKSVSISVPLDIPKNASRAVARFIFNDEADFLSGFYGYALKGLTVLGLIWLASMIVNNFS